ncbi:hypothetical protein K9L97_01095 [Candidatus Woesearchaeota archaeon]|nr:hypothetical protein [Candidatus Woesearchaeota archaeon]
MKDVKNAFIFLILLITITIILTSCSQNVTYDFPSAPENCTKTVLERKSDLLSEGETMESNKQFALRMYDCLQEENQKGFIRITYFVSQSFADQLTQNMFPPKEFLEKNAFSSDEFKYAKKEFLDYKDVNCDDGGTLKYYKIKMIFEKINPSLDTNYPKYSINISKVKAGDYVIYEQLKYKKDKLYVEIDKQTKNKDSGTILNTLNELGYFCQ